MITAFDHYTVRAADLAASWRFYEQVLGLRCELRAGTAVPSALVYVGGLPVVNLFEATPEQNGIFEHFASVADPESPAWRTGRLQHVGFWADDTDGLRARLTEHGVPFRERGMADKYQFVVYDPDGVEIEINIPLSQG
ncbi:MAG: hypothetical protein EXR58_04345 [Chloroflexi bacterium]|nr:hypothetical protein [Chloroflexota bacterium]